VRRVHKLDRQALYERHSRGDFLERLRQEWTRDYDFVLLDSRTGLTDIGGICTIHLPDVVVSVFTANHQSMEGTCLYGGAFQRAATGFLL
jgi:MinD-like ATPase involved in chromosome partitioning or flagellar assembly